MSDPYKGTTLMFCDILGDAEQSFAWLPKKTFEGEWVWLRKVWRRLCVVKPHLDGPSDPWWQYAIARRKDWTT